MQAHSCGDVKGLVGRMLQLTLILYMWEDLQCVVLQHVR